MNKISLLQEARLMNRAVLGFFALVIFFSSCLSGCAWLNRYQREGALSVPGLKEPVTVVRDEKGMAYIYAQNRDDLLLAQGFVTAQDRLFQMDLNRRFAAGRISEFAGERAKRLDIKMRTLGLYRQAGRHARMLDAPSLRFFQQFADGVNAYLETRRNERPLEYKLAGFRPEPWTVTDSLAVVYLMGWDTSANLQTEIVTQMLVEKLGEERAREIFPLNVNPDDAPASVSQETSPESAPPSTGIFSSPNWRAWLERPFLALGSNNWATGPKRSAGGKPIVANDPHMDARILPGPWVPMGLILPESRMVGVNIAGIPGIVVGRNTHVAIGSTNAYGDMQDLYVETVDPAHPGRYLEGSDSVPFQVTEETIRIKDKRADGGWREEPVRIRHTRRGPVISDLFPGLDTDKLITVRFAPFESMHPSIGLDQVFFARSVDDVRRALEQVNYICINFVFADTEGNIGWQVSGRLPVRAQGDGTVPLKVIDRTDNWTGWIPFDQMPHQVNPEKGWVGTCNQRTVGQDYPYYFSSYFSPSYRYRRLKQLMNRSSSVSVDDHWRFQRDTRNLMAERIAPVMARALLAHEDTRRMGKILSDWDFHDDPDQAAPTIFQATYRRFAFRVFRDELGGEETRTYLNNWYIWQERLGGMVLSGASPWFDDLGTEDVRETRDMLFHLAALDAAEELADRMGNNPDKWRWGRVHRLEFVSPLRRTGFGKGMLGGSSHPYPGSGETLWRGWYDLDAPFDVTHSAALRMVADLSDTEKVMAVLPGGVSGRLFHPHNKDQVPDFLSGEKRYWWFSDEAIRSHAVSTLVLTP
jgi:penicillin amidase